MEALDLRPHHHQLLRVGIGQRLQQRCVIDSEDCGVRTHAERQRQQNRERQPRILEQHTDAEAKVAEQILHECTSLMLSKTHFGPGNRYAMGRHSVQKYSLLAVMLHTVALKTGEGKRGVPLRKPASLDYVFAAKKTQPS